jgi:GT2 family glycosyltransferase
MPTVSVIIANWNGRHLLAECLDSLKRQTFRDFEVIVVDNGSADGSVDFLREKYSGFAVVLPQEKNLGFGVANNIGIRLARGKYVALLNNDAVADERWLEELVKAAEADEKRRAASHLPQNKQNVRLKLEGLEDRAYGGGMPGWEATTPVRGGEHRPVGMFASKILNYANREAIDNIGHLFYPDGLNRGHARLEKDDGRYDTPAEALFPSGCAALYRKEMFDSIGLFDEDFFAYGDDTDIGVRGRIAGWGCWYVPTAVAYHKYSMTAGEYSPLKAFLVERNRVFVALKCLPLSMLLLSPWYTLKRLVLQAYGALSGRGAAGEFTKGRGAFSLVWLLIKAYLSALKRLPKMLKRRSAVWKNAKLSPREVRQLLGRFAISARELALKK